MTHVRPLFFFFFFFFFFSFLFASVETDILDTAKLHMPCSAERWPCVWRIEAEPRRSHSGKGKESGLCCETKLAKQ